MSILRELDSLPYHQLSDLGIDVLNEPIEVMPVTHYTLGGVRINEWAETTVAGLFAAGEIEGSIHGANRTSGNALAETQVFGRRAGIRAAEYARDVGLVPPDAGEIQAEAERLEQLLSERSDCLRPIELKRKIKALMHTYVHHRRDAAGLTTALQGLRHLRQTDLPRVRATRAHRIYNYEWQEAIEVTSMIDLAEMVTASAFAREESRGHHWRTDFPVMRREWEKHTIVRKHGEARFEITEAPVIRLKDRTKERRTADPSLINAGVLDEYQGSG
jgi:fumarate reductase (CoM/CoB) subunit A